MREPGPGWKDGWVAVLAAAAGPAAAALQETGALALGPSTTLWPIGLVVLVAGIGLLTGGRLWARDARALGAIVLLSNGAVLSLYGFLLLFFGLGGSR